MKLRNSRAFTLIIAALIFTFHVIQAQTPCTYSLELKDSFGDGWNGSSLTVSIAGNENSYTLDGIADNGSRRVFELAVTDGDGISLEFVGTSFLSEVSYALSDSEGFLIFADGPEPASGVVLQTTANCPSCPRIDSLSVSIDDVDALCADISWGQSRVAGTYLVEFGPSGFMPGTGNIIQTDSLFANIPDLSENTSYDLYLSVDCGGETSKTVGPYSFRTIWLNDVGIIDIITPATGCALGVEEIEVYIQNYGATPQTLIPFNYSVNGIPGQVTMPQDGLYTGVISNDSMASTAFDAKFNFLVPGEYTIKAWTELEEDSQINNDTFTKKVVHIPVITSYPYLFNFDLWGGGWLPDDQGTNSSWAYGRPSGELINSDANGGGNAWVTNLNGIYNLNEKSYLVSPCLDFTGLSEDPLISFAINFNSESCCDEAWVELSVDGGDSWRKVGAAGTGINWYNDGENDWWDGNGGFEGWVVAQNTLAGAAGVSEARVRLVFSSDATLSEEGFGFDNVAINIPLKADLFSLGGRHFSTSECGDPLDTISMVILNNGTEIQQSFSLGYQVNGGPVITETVSNFTIGPGGEVPYTFQSPFNSTEPGIYQIKAWVNLPGDGNVFNDTTTFEFEILPPEPLPLIANFEDGQLPFGWSSTSSSPTPVGDGHNNTSFVLQTNLHSDNILYQVVTNNIGPINPGDSLTFDYRYTDWLAGINPTQLGSDKLLVQISIDCGEIFNTVFRIDSTNHIASADMANVKVDLDQFAGENIKIRFFATWGLGDYWLDIDNVNIIGCPQTLGLSFQTQSESTAGNEDGQIIAIPGMGLGPYSFSWSNAATSDTITGLSAGNYTVTVTDINGCVDEAAVDLGTCPGNLNLSVTATEESSEGKSDGQASVTPGAGNGPYIYQWSNGETSSSAKNLTADNYTVTVTDSNGCTDEATVKIIVTTTYNIPDLHSFTLAPNPTNHSALLALEFTQSIKQVEIQLLNIIGQQLYKITDQNVQSGQYELNLLDFPGGVYFVRIAVGNQAHILRLVRTR